MGDLEAEQGKPLSDAEKHAEYMRRVYRVFNHAMKTGQFRIEAPFLDDCARRNDKRNAYVKLAVSDELVKSIKGDEDRRPDVLLFIIPAEVGRESESRIIRPGKGVR